MGVWIKAVFRQSTAAHKTSNHCLFSIPPESPSVEKVALNFWAQPLLTLSAASYGKKLFKPLTDQHVGVGVVGNTLFSHSVLFTQGCEWIPPNGLFIKMLLA